jgi:hypothetical protein
MQTGSRSQHLMSGVQSALVTAYFAGLEQTNLREFLLIDNPAHPGEYFPRASGMRFTAKST